MKHNQAYISHPLSPAPRTRTFRRLSTDATTSPTSPTSTTSASSTSSTLSISIEDKPIRRNPNSHTRTASFLEFPSISSTDTSASTTPYDYISSESLTSSVPTFTRRLSSPLSNSRYSPNIARSSQLGSRTIQIPNTPQHFSTFSRDDSSDLADPTMHSTSTTRAWSNYYQNRQYYRDGYFISPVDAGFPTNNIQSIFKGILPIGDTDDEDEAEGGWEEQAESERIQHMRHSVIKMTSTIRDNYILPTSGFAGGTVDVSLTSGHAGVAYMFFHLFSRIDGTLDLMIRNRSTAVTTCEYFSFTPVLADERPRIQQFIHAQQQYAQGLLQFAVDYIEYALSMIDSYEGRVLSLQHELRERDDVVLSHENLISEQLSPKLKGSSTTYPLSFLQSRSGIHALAAVIYHHRARYLIAFPMAPRTVCSQAYTPEYNVQRRDEEIQKLIAISPKSDDEAMTNDITYGRAGYLHACAFVQSNLWSSMELSKYMESTNTQPEDLPEIGPDSHEGSKPFEITTSYSYLKQSGNIEHMGFDKLHDQIQSLRQTMEVVADDLIQYLPRACDESSQCYLGISRGVSGIVYILSLLEWKLNDDNYVKAIKSAAQFITSQQRDDGNLPVQINDNHDEPIVEVNHGASGLALLMARLHTLWPEEESYRKSALLAAECVWAYGLTKKGIGLHAGITGNGNSLLAVYHMTNNPVYLKRAWSFARFTTYPERQRGLLRLREYPYSLGSGLAGAVCFYSDLTVSKWHRSVFPGLDVLL